MRYVLAFFGVVLLASGLLEVGSIQAQEPSLSLADQLLAEGAPALAAAAAEQGDPLRGAWVFYQPHLMCSRCHTGDDKTRLGPDLAKLGPKITAQHLAESVLVPSKVVNKDFQTVTLITAQGRALTGLVVEESETEVALKDTDGKRTVIAKADIEERLPGKSLMPTGLANLVGDRQAFLDLLRYLIDITQHGPERAAQLQPPPAFFAARKLPAYENTLDHAGLIADLDEQSFKRGQAIYARACINCHGTHDKQGSLPTSLRFASGKFKNGSDPLSMYRTVTHGYGMMAPQTWMVPQEKYDVIHYIREAYVKPTNPSQYAAADAAYRARLPQGSTRGPAPAKFQPWEAMNYGPSLIHTYEIGAKNFAYKGVAMRLDAGPGGVTQGRHWMAFDHDTLRAAGAWSGQGFIDFNGIMFNGRHGAHPQNKGRITLSNQVGPGWANPTTQSFEDPRLRGRDDKPYGPLPRSWAHYKGLYHYGNQTIVSYTVGDSKVLETPSVDAHGDSPIFIRSINIGPRKTPQTLLVAQVDQAKISHLEQSGNGVAHLRFGQTAQGESQPVGDGPVQFHGATMLQVRRPGDFAMTQADFSITARIRTQKGGTIFSKAKPDQQWTPDGKTLFVRGGRLVYDIGWVGQVASKTPVANNRWRDVALTVDGKSGRVSLYVDGKLDNTGQLAPKDQPSKQVVKIGYTSSNFPRPQSYFQGDLRNVRFYSRKLTDDQVSAISQADAETNKSLKAGLLAHWPLTAVEANAVVDTAGGKHPAVVMRGEQTTGPAQSLAAGGVGLPKDAAWRSDSQGRLLLTLPPGNQPLQFCVWTSAVENPAGAVAAIERSQALRTVDLAPFTQGGPARWPEVLETPKILGPDGGAFAIDVLSHPESNPWNCRVRFTGLDFLDADRAIVSCWDGDVWQVSGLKEESKTLHWRRIASGLFQPLGVKIVDGLIYLSCRDQIVILHDVNGDQETDFYESFNNDHQVTEHFHEFAMGLQTDNAGDFYYAKSARHALTALVPHHGTLLRVSKDGTRTDIVANGFRAANGVCVNPDGTFIVTDQEGHWNPKNRINWVSEGGFYGNMFGYHDVTDSSDAAMDQPLCWITNAFDRSPAELLWVDSPKWKRMNHSLLNLSYGYGKVYITPHEKVNGQMQGGMCALPIPDFPTGVARGRFHAADQHLYLCGMVAWGSNRSAPGGLYRLRATGKPAHLPVGLKAKTGRLEIEFSDPLDPAACKELKRYAIKTWALKRTAGYGSKHYDEQSLTIASTALSADGRTLTIHLPDLKPTWCMEIKYRLSSAGGQPVEGVIHNTIHALGK